MALFDTSFAEADPQIVTSLPTGVQTGYELYYKVGSGDTAIYWRCKYDSTITDVYKWRFVGGAPLFARLSTATATASGTYVTLDSSTPQVTIPGIGVYEISQGCYVTTPGAGRFGICNIQSNGSIPGDDNDAAFYTAPGVNQFDSISSAFTRTIASISTSAVVVQVYRTDGASNTFGNRWLRVSPLRLG